MEILIISDSLMKPVSNDIDNFKCINWESQTFGPLSHYDAIIIQTNRAGQITAMSCLAPALKPFNLELPYNPKRRPIYYVAQNIN